MVCQGQCGQTGLDLAGAPHSYHFPAPQWNSGNSPNILTPLPSPKWKWTRLYAPSARPAAARRAATLAARGRSNAPTRSHARPVLSESIRNCVHTTRQLISASMQEARHSPSIPATTTLPTPAHGSRRGKSGTKSALNLTESKRRWSCSATTFANRGRPPADSKTPPTWTRRMTMPPPRTSRPAIRPASAPPTTFSRRMSTLADTVLRPW